MSNRSTKAGVALVGDRGPEAADYDRFFTLLDELIEKARKDTTPAPTSAPTAPKP
jgi:hypothetical protein